MRRTGKELTDVGGTDESEMTAQKGTSSNPKATSDVHESVHESGFASLSSNPPLASPSQVSLTTTTNNTVFSVTITETKSSP